MKKEWNSLDAFMAENLSEFRPFAYFDKHMDCIRVKIQDCSVTEVRLSRFFTLLRPNYGDLARENRAVGFTIKGVAHIFNLLKLPMDGVLDLAEIMDAIVRMFPDETVKMVVEEFDMDVKKNKLTVDFRDERLAA